MARVLTRPLFRKGGLSQTPRPTYRGGGLTTIRPRYRNGGMNGIMSGIVPRRGYANGPATPEEILERIQVQGLPYLTMPKIEDKYQKFIKRKDPITYPEEGSLVAGYDEGKQALHEFYQTPEGEEYIKKPLIAKMKEQVAKRKAAGLPVDEIVTKETVAGPMEYLQEEAVPGEVKTIPDIETPVVSDEEAMESYMKMFEKAAGTDPDETKRSKWLELAKFGANVLGQPGGDLAGAIGKAAAPSIEGLGKTMAEDRAAKRQLRIAGLQAYLKGKDPGTIGKAVKDIMAANKNLSKQEALTLALRSGTATRESTAEDRTQKIQDTLYKSGFVKNEVYARDAALALQESVEQGVPSTRYTKLPEDPGDRKDGAYYIDPDSGILGRYNKSTKEIIEPGDPGFKPKKK